MPTGESAWLVERRPNEGMPLYLAAMTTTDPAMFTGLFAWTSDPNRALRFARQIDASAFVGAMLKQSEYTALKGTLSGLREGDPDPAVVEHGWID